MSMPQDRHTKSVMWEARRLINKRKVLTRETPLPFTCKDKNRGGSLRPLTSVVPCQMEAASTSTSGFEITVGKRHKPQH